MNKIITKHVEYRGKSIKVEDLKDNSNIKIEVECKHGKRFVRWNRRNQLCRKCAVEQGLYNTSKNGRNITWGDKISESKKGIKLSDKHKKSLSVSHYKVNENEWPGFYEKSEIHRLRDSIKYKDFREDVLKRDNYKCVLSGRKGYLEVHHKNSVNKYKDEILNIDNAITLHASVHSTFHLIYGNGNNTVFQFEEFKKIFKAEKQKIFFLCGQNGSGKTTISNKLKDKFHVIHYDEISNKDLLSVLNSIPNNKPILLDIPTLISTFYKMLISDFNINAIFILESKDVIRNRLLSRGGKITSSVDRRYKRMRSLSKKYSIFSGTANDVYEYLVKLQL